MTFVIILIRFLYQKIINQKLNFDLFLKFSATVALLLDPIFWIWKYLKFHALDPSGDFPLYICSLFWMILPIVAFSKKKDLLYRSALTCLITICLFGGIFGMVFNPHLDNFFGFRAQLSLFYHTLMLTVIILIWITDYYKAEPNDRFVFILPVIPLLAVDFIINQKYDYDYGYLNGGAGTVLEIISNKTGVLTFVLLFYGLMFGLSYIMINQRLKKQRKN